MSTVSLRPRVGQVPWIIGNVLKDVWGGMTDIKADLAFSKAAVICCEHTLSYQEEVR